MSIAPRKRYQNTTVRVPKHLYEQAKSALSRSRESSLNEFVVQAIEEKLRRQSEAEIDAAFAQMAHDPDYQRDSLALAREFEKSDWEAFNGHYDSGALVDLTQSGKPSINSTEARSHGRTSKARPR